MDIHDLKCFLHLAQTLHFGNSAQALYMSASTLSRQIQRLEDEVGEPLFLRDNRRVELTQAGKILQQFAQNTVWEYEQLRHQLDYQRQIDQTILTGELRIFCSVTAAYSHLPSILDRFRAAYPAVEIKLTTGDAADALEKVTTNEADLGIAGQPSHLPNTILFHKIGDIDLVLIAPNMQGSLRDSLQQTTIDWSKIPFILPEHGPSRKRVDQWFKQQKITHPHIYATVAGHEAIVPMVALGCGVAIIPEVVLDNSPDTMKARVTKIAVPELTAFDLGICVQKKRLNESLIEAFWAVL